MAVQTPRTSATKGQILAAARRVLTREGGAGLSTRTVAAEAGVNLSLIHYHFGSREGLLLAVLDDMNAALLDRQRDLYDRKDLALSVKWHQAVEFYRADLKSGYVRILLELAAEGLSNPQLAARVRLALRGWRELLVGVAADTRANSRRMPFEPAEVATLIVSFWWGMELQHLLGVAEEDGHFWQTLATIERLILRWEGGESDAPNVSVDRGRRRTREGARRRR